MLIHTNATDKFITVTTLICQQIHQTNTDKCWVETNRSRVKTNRCRWRNHSRPKRSCGKTHKSSVLNFVSQHGFNKSYKSLWLQCEQICHDHLNMTQDQRKIYLAATILMEHTHKNLSGVGKHFHQLHWFTWNLGIIIMSCSLCCDLEEEQIRAPLYL